MNKLIKFFCFYFEYNFPEIKTHVSGLRQTGRLNNYCIKNKFYFYLCYDINSEKIIYKDV